jgi:hypothetical protein
MRGSAAKLEACWSPRDRTRTKAKNRLNKFLGDVVSDTVSISEFIPVHGLAETNGSKCYGRIEPIFCGINSLSLERSTVECAEFNVKTGQVMMDQ